MAKISHLKSAKAVRADDRVVIKLRLSVEQGRALDAWIDLQPDEQVSRPDAVRRLLAPLLASATTRTPAE